LPPPPRSPPFPYTTLFRSDRVFVAMSGGVDSSLAAALLADRGEDVVGVWMRLTPAGTSSDSPRCCGTDEAGEQARRAAAHLGIPDRKSTRLNSSHGSISYA